MWSTCFSKTTVATAFRLPVRSSRKRLAQYSAIIRASRGGRWSGRSFENDPVARRVLSDLVAHRVSRRPHLREDIRKVARTLVRRFVQDPGGPAHRHDWEMVAEMHRRWKAKPDLHTIWFGHAGGRHVMPFRSDWHIFDLLFEVDMTFAVTLIETYEEPHQPAMILQWALDPNRRFADWERLMAAALRAFDDDGAWNGRVLLPLLLQVAEDALRSGRGHRDQEDNVARRDARLAQLAQSVASIVRTRTDGTAAALRWSGWLFRRAMSALDGEPIPFPRDADSRARSAWLTIEALVEAPTSTGWLDLRPADVAAEDELCLKAVCSLAALKHERAVPSHSLLLEMLPDEPEDFLDGEGGRRMRELPSLFVIWGKRPDAFGTRLLAASLFAGDVAATFANLWRRTLVLREIAEHAHAFRSDDAGYDDRAGRASQTIRFVIGLGINLIDYVQDARQKGLSADRRATSLALFATLHDATREMLAIDIVGRRDMENLHDHLCVRRFIYGDDHIGNHPVAACLSERDRPTAGELLVERSAVDRAFFESLQTLRINDISPERIARALKGVGVDLGQLVQQAQRLNSIEHIRTIDVTGFGAAT